MVRRENYQRPMDLKSLDNLDIKQMTISEVLRFLNCNCEKVQEDDLMEFIWEPTRGIMEASSSEQKVMAGISIQKGKSLKSSTMGKSEKLRQNSVIVMMYNILLDIMMIVKGRNGVAAPKIWEQ